MTGSDDRGRRLRVELAPSTIGPSSARSGRTSAASEAVIRLSHRLARDTRRVCLGLCVGRFRQVRVAGPQRVESDLLTMASEFQSDLGAVDELVVRKAVPQTAELVLAETAGST